MIRCGFSISQIGTDRHRMGSMEIGLGEAMVDGGVRTGKGVLYVSDILGAGYIPVEGRNAFIHGI